ncbi:hypothetical protein [Streptomyces huiliensis]|uniref:hypothetical protein n=1 Tax=Streptomyces huiliensis TaxID=2876027 RepID=UPI001CBDE4C9|nr:hypothetical protein [Streptomyces huiliensis]MBZ4320641.1 hypothetical protein [Streptomyces huiliensis]
MKRSALVRASAVPLTLSAVALTFGSPARAGGLGAGVLSPAVGNGCAARSAAAAQGAASRVTSAAGGNVLGLPVSGPLNQCGGAEVPVFDLTKTVKVPKQCADVLNQSLLSVVGDPEDESLHPKPSASCLAALQKAVP